MSEGNRRTAIVTGAARRVGRAIASGLIARGWTVVAHVHHADDPVPDGAIKVAADLTEPDAAERIVGAAESRPAIALLVNNAARFAWDSAGEFNGAEFDAHMAVNGRAPIALMEVMAARHRQGEDACIVNILDAKLAAPNADFLGYTLSKQVLAAASDLYARALAPKGIRVNAIAPALMLQSPGQSADNYARMHDMNPLNRGVEPSDVLDAIIYLAEARVVTGQTIILDGGQRFMGLDRDVQFLERP